MAIKNLLRSTGSAFRLGATLVAMAGMSAFLASCGGGGVAPVSSSSTTVSILPGAPELYEGVATSITISGGRSPYNIFSSNPSVVPPPPQSTGVFVLTSNPVPADTTVKITIQDSANPPTQTDFTMNVHASQLNNGIQVIPTSTGQTCGTAVCTGGTATVSSTSAVANVVQRGRTVQFSVVTGDFKFQTPGTNTQVSSIFTTTDSAGVASAQIIALAAAPSQTAVLQVTDYPTGQGGLPGQARKFAFQIQQVTLSTVISINPAVITWQGPYNDACVAGGLSTHYIFGGKPPYTISTTSPAGVTFTVSDPAPGPGGSAIETKEGGAVMVSTTGVVCTLPGAGITMLVRDLTGGIATFTVNNQLGASARPVVTPPATVVLPSPTLNPPSLGPLDCGVTASTFVDQTTPSGYQGTAPVISVTALEPNRISASVAGNIISVTRVGNGPGGQSSSLVRVSNGVSFTDMTVTLSAASNGTTTNSNSYACSIGNSTLTPITLPLASKITIHLATPGVNPTQPTTISGGTPPFTVTSVGPGVAQVSADGVVFQNSITLQSNTVPYIVKGLTQGSTYVTVVDSSPVASGGPLTTVQIVDVVSP